MAKAFLVTDLGFGDQTKGATTDFLVEKTGAKLVARFNGGAQAAHHVVHDSKTQHTFHLFGSGTFKGAETYLSRHVLFDPLALIYEVLDLKKLGVTDPIDLIHVDPECLITTSFHCAVNRIRASIDNTGTCGMGIAETVRYNLNFPNESLKFKHLFESKRQITDRLEAIRKWAKTEIEVMMCTSYWGKTPIIDQEVLKKCYNIINNQTEFDSLVRIYIDIAKRIGMPNPYLLSSSLKTGPVVFEGAQGILLDQDYGFHPHTTWSNCTTRNARELLAEIGHTEICSIGVLRAYQTRHGYGPMPTETKLEVSEPTNPSNKWQGDFRVGDFDAVLANYAIAVSGGIDYLAVSHLDVVESIPKPKIVTEYSDELGFKINNIPIIDPLNLELRAKLTKKLSTVKSVCPVKFNLDLITNILEKNILIEGRGPMSADRKVDKNIWNRLN